MMYSSVVMSPPTPGGDSSANETAGQSAGSSLRGRGALKCDVPAADGLRCRLAHECTLARACDSGIYKHTGVHTQMHMERKMHG